MTFELSFNSAYSDFSSWGYTDPMSCFGVSAPFSASFPPLFSFEKYSYDSFKLDSFYTDALNPYGSFPLPELTFKPKTEAPFVGSYKSFAPLPPLQVDLQPKLTTNNYKLGSLTRNKSRRVSGSAEYKNYSRREALSKAANDSRLEYIGNGGTGWSLSSGSFRNDIQYATAGTTKALNNIISEIRQTTGNENFSINITSALGTAGSPHCANGGHYDPNATKLDIGGYNGNVAKAQKDANLLLATGKFNWVYVERSGDGVHLDVRIKPEYLRECNA